MAQEEQDPRGADYVTPARIRRDLKARDKGWLRAKASVHLGNARGQVHQEIHGGGPGGADGADGGGEDHGGGPSASQPAPQDPAPPRGITAKDHLEDLPAPRSNRTAKRRRTGTNARCNLIDRAKALAHIATD